jgi:ABC-type Fe3+ transport system permease subunit
VAAFAQLRHESMCVVLLLINSNVRSSNNAACLFNARSCAPRQRRGAATGVCVCVVSNVCACVYLLLVMCVAYTFARRLFTRRRKFRVQSSDSKN